MERGKGKKTGRQRRSSCVTSEHSQVRACSIIMDRRIADDALSQCSSFKRPAANERASTNLNDSHVVTLPSPKHLKVSHSDNQRLLEVPVVSIARLSAEALAHLNVTATSHVARAATNDYVTTTTMHLLLKQFEDAAQALFDATMDIDWPDGGEEDDKDEEEGEEMGLESLINSALLTELRARAHNAKTSGIVNKIATKKLVKLLFLLNHIVKSGCRILPNNCSDDENDNDDGDNLERRMSAIFKLVHPAMDAAITVIYIMTSPEMPKAVFHEDAIERVCNLAVKQTNNIYKCFANHRRGKRSLSRRTNEMISKLYTSVCSLVDLLSDLVDLQELTDTVILKMSTLAISPFFAEDVVELQQVSLKLITNLFSRYEKHRQLIQDEIIFSLAHLPQNKKSLKSYRIHEGGRNVHIITALTLKLIQSTIRPPSETTTVRSSKHNLGSEDGASYKYAMQTMIFFLNSFIAKWTSKGEDAQKIDLSLIHGFVLDLLALITDPEWPAAEPALTILGNILMKQISNRTAEAVTRNAALELIGVIAVELGKTAATFEYDRLIVEDLLSRQSDVDVTFFLQQSLLQYLCTLASDTNDSTIACARQFYIEQWRSDSAHAVESDAASVSHCSESDFGTSSHAHYHRNNMTTASQYASSAFDLRPEIALTRQMASAVVRYLSSKRRSSGCGPDYCINQILSVLCETTIAVRTKAIRCLTHVTEADPSILSREDVRAAVHSRLTDSSASVREACIDLIGKFITQHPDLIEHYYSMLGDHINDVSVNVRKRIIKIFREICIAHPSFPNIPDMCIKMIWRAGDEDGVKKLVNETFQTIWFTPIPVDRSRAGIGQRVQNILKVISECSKGALNWLEQLVLNLLRTTDKDGKRINTHELENACRQIVDGLVDSLHGYAEKRKSDNHADATDNDTTLVSCFKALYIFCKAKRELLTKHSQTIHPYLRRKFTGEKVDSRICYHVASILQLSVPLMSAVASQKSDTQQVFLDQLEDDLSHLVKTSRLIVVRSCIECLAQVVKHITHNFTLVSDCFAHFFRQLLACLSSQTTKRTKTNRVPVELLRAIFVVGRLCRHFDFDSIDFGSYTKPVTKSVFRAILSLVSNARSDISLAAISALGCVVVGRPHYMIGRTLKELYLRILCPLDQQQMPSGRLQQRHTQVSRQQGGRQQQELPDGQPDLFSVAVRCEVLRNIRMYLLEDELEMISADAQWKTIQDKASLKEMADIQSGMASTVIQIYLGLILESYFHLDPSLRHCVLDVITVVLHQGLVHPGQCVPYLICVCSDPDPGIRGKGAPWLTEINKKYPGIIQSKAIKGVQMSYRLHRLLCSSTAWLCVGDMGNDEMSVTRGVRCETSPIACNNSLYLLLRHNRGQRRVLLASMLKLFEDNNNTDLEQLVFLADNLAHFRYQQQEEPLFVIHQLDITVSVSGSNLLQAFTDIFYPHRCRQKKSKVANLSSSYVGLDGERNDEEEEGEVYEDDDDDEEDDNETVTTLIGRCPDDLSAAFDCYRACQSCLLLLSLKSHLKSVYGISENVIQQYSPLDKTKTGERNLTVKNNSMFDPRVALDVVRDSTIASLTRTELVKFYMKFKKLILTFDPVDDDDNDNVSPADDVAAVEAALPLILSPPADCVGATDDEGFESIMESFGESDLGDDEDRPAKKSYGARKRLAGGGAHDSAAQLKKPRKRTVARRSSTCTTDDL